MDISIDIIEYAVPLIDRETISGVTFMRVEKESPKLIGVETSKKKLTRKERRKLKAANAQKSE